ncbi:MAG: hypothetical protein CMH36_08530 [Microbacterium sp.]|jgi:hypothetical protein|uniref:DUF3618 domain-containing protein n=1 Tax=Microbacterium ginsengisoli TaxID=400772 RepID=A0A0F0LV21_9MICO|nr:MULTISPECIES: hypothetical protein [Microbacterium]MAL06857.1 hypothetical protein [Microbacterium sp.]MCK9918616.1 hypothetical protein [Microbacteriaceae bacterium K1510]KJL36539.1 hypothetical protein RR49_01549 [Microbacterium ginsengisoli]KQR91621.1 hypothetical protein ASF93_06815 [Microbacterium sp. Leaf347]MBN9197907.1 hypothetical protein [Microbacterium ginsengisoli]
MTEQVPVPRTAVPLGIDDPVEAARAELKAALAAIEHKVNVPRRFEKATEARISRYRDFARKNPAGAIAATVAAAAAIGGVVWLAVRTYVR